MLHLALPWAARRGVRLAAATVDHGLRPGSAGEAERVATVCADLGLAHTTLHWSWDRRGNLQEAARLGRRRLLAEWARREGLSAVAMGHTRDDQAETVLLRLMRGSGVDGLSAMEVDRRDEVRWLRPLLGVRREALRQWLRDAGLNWAEDPSNADRRFRRVRVRQAMEALELDQDRLAETAARMRMARAALESLAEEAARACVAVESGDLLIFLGRFDTWPEETRLRLFAEGLRWISGAPYRPRLNALRAALDEARRVPRTLHGVLVSPERGRLRLTREARAVTEARAAPGEPWDGRWIVEGPARPGDEVRMLGEAGLIQRGVVRLALPRASLAASPAVWRGGELRAAPLAGFGQGWTVRLADRRDVFTLSGGTR
ncbi:tRNA lysidine(34) synthetase TilS [Rhodobacteraceae bacterium MCCB 386]|nr:tRNA lysidine(34) synthetase TilS [Roseitranquillus sediminis]